MGFVVVDVDVSEKEEDGQASTTFLAKATASLGGRTDRMIFDSLAIVSSELSCIPASLALSTVLAERSFKVERIRKPCFDKTDAIAEPIAPAEITETVVILC